MAEKKQKIKKKKGGFDMNIMKKETENFPFVKSVFSDFFDTGIEKFFDFNLDNKWFKRIPATNIWADEKAYTIEVAAPGLKKEDFKVTIENDMLNISAEKEETVEEKKKNFTRREYNFSSFARSFYVPDVVSMDKIDAHYENGLLRLVLPKKEEAKKNGAKKIAIS